MSIAGKLLYNFYHKPRIKREVVKKYGGEANYSQMLAGEREMRRYAFDQLVINGDFNNSGQFKLNFLTGEKFIHQTLFCTYSFFKWLTLEESSNFSVNYYNDGTLSTSTVTFLKARFPQINLVGREETKRALQVCLPKSSFPYLNKKIASLPLFKKMIYPHLNNEGLSAFLDSDMLFVKRPEAFLSWLYLWKENKNTGFCIQDINRSYGYQESEILKVWPEPVKNDINSGMYAICSAQIDFELIESLIKEFETRFGSQYFMEQLITAILLEKNGNLFVAPRSEYIVSPTQDQVINQSGVLHHYVNFSKEFYFKESWKKQIM